MVPHPKAFSVNFSFPPTPIPNRRKFGERGVEDLQSVFEINYYPLSLQLSVQLLNE